MTYTAHPQQGFSINEQAQSQTIVPIQEPLTSRDRRIIGEIIGEHPESVRTIWIEGGITVWVQFVDGGLLPFD
ncbi:hypothetical protein [Komarekiella delphini-convector]|uniref:hypothetical protein n=1 Tax=Komarekiella delphini-convector TaxID=3050158 RepID=UPI001CD86D18|nr:hypothetical protein [Komarekiella delphini-convector]